MRAIELSRDETLKKINDILEAYGLPLWTKERLGDIEAGKCQIIDMKDVTEITDDRIEITVRMLTPYGVETDIRLRFGGTVHYVLPYLTVTGTNLEVQHYVALVKRWRVEHGEWSFQLPHGLAYTERHSPAIDALESPSHQVLKNAFGQECMDSLSAAKIMPMGGLTLKWETRRCAAYMLVATVNKQFERKKGDGEIVLLKWRDVLSHIDQGKYITDLGTVAVLLKADRNYPNLSERK